MSDFNKKRRILLVDDNPVNLKILEKILCEDYETVTANNGKDALGKLCSSVPSLPFSLVILDIIMPVMDGYEVLKQMRSDIRLKEIPVIVASAAQKDENIDVEEKALLLGANDYIAKPYKPTVLKRRIENTLYVHDTADFVSMVRNDALTGVYSKEYFYIEASEILKQNSDRKYDLICCDIERFKLVNDLYGTAIGDKLLKSCAEIYKEKIYGYGICGRIGPDIFAFLLRHQDVDYGKYFNETINKINKLNIGLNIEIKYGIYPIYDRNEPLSLMCDHTILALNSIKGKYGVVYQYYDDSIRNKLVEEQYLITHMKEALENHEFEVYFQPKYEIKSGTIVGAEALVRWNDPNKGFLSPGSFIPLFEKNGFITELDKFVWEESLKFLNKYIKSGKNPVPISLNMSRADLYHSEIDKCILQLVHKYSIKPQMIHLEVTESAYTDDPQQLIEMLNRLKALGFKIDMDDFGTGYSSLNMLSDLPIDVLKLDMGFMRNKEQATNRNVLSFIISLAKWMNLDIIAEGAETKEQIEMLQSLGCNVVQGYYFSRPLTEKDFEDRLSLQQKHQENLSDSPQSAKDIPLSSVLMVSENEDTINTFNNIFEGHYCVRTVDYNCNLNELFNKHKQVIEIVILDYNALLADDLIKQNIEVCRNFNIPVIVALPNKDHVEKAIDLGFMDFLTKPFKKKFTLNRVDVIIKNSKLSEESLEREIASAISEMKKRAEQDSLTGLLNRAEFESQVQVQLNNIDIENAYFIMLDIDNFKRINDTLGHAVGDQALRSLANYIHKLFPGNDILGRMGGDEFAVFVPHCENKIELQNRVDTLCHSFLIDINGMTITCSAGICSTKDSQVDFGTLYENADTALLVAKAQGKSRYKYYKKGMEIPSDSSLERNAMLLLDETSDATFVCDAITSEIIYINDTACKLVGKSKRSCLGLRCYQVFWDQCHNCDRCTSINKCKNYFYEEDTVLKDGITQIHIKAKIENWGGRKVKVHYLQLLNKLNEVMKYGKL